MKTLVLSMGLAIAVAAFFAVSQRRQINAARSELARLESKAAEQADRPPVASSSTVALDEEIARLRGANRDIHKLRGQISQAREKRRGIEQLATENARLRQQVDEIKANPGGNQVQPFPFTNKGQATPEAAIESAFWAMYQGDFAALSMLMPGMTAEFERLPAAEKTNQITVLRGMAAMIGKIEVLEQQSERPDEVRVTVRMTRRAGLDSMDAPFPEKSGFILRRNDERWQIVGQH